jgi:hypothetical protein
MQSTGQRPITPAWLVTAPWKRRAAIALLASSTIRTPPPSDRSPSVVPHSRPCRSRFLRDPEKKLRGSGACGSGGQARTETADHHRCAAVQAAEGNHRPDVRVHLGVHVVVLGCAASTGRVARAQRWRSRFHRHRHGHATHRHATPPPPPTPTPTPRNATQRNATQRNATQRRATQRRATPRNAAPRNAAQRQRHAAAAAADANPAAAAANADANANARRARNTASVPDACRPSRTSRALRGPPATSHRSRRARGGRRPGSSPRRPFSARAAGGRPAC